MCYFITVAVPDRHADRIGDVFAGEFQTYPTVNPVVVAALPAGYTARVLTSGMCCCDLYASPRSPTDPDPAAHLRQKYEKLGWSEAKIRRAIEQSTTHAAKSNLPTSGLRSDVVDGLQTLCRAAGSVAVFVHWYSGGVETEQFSLSRAKHCECDAIPARAEQLAHDELLIAGTRRVG